MRVLSADFRLRLKNRKSQPFKRAASADDATNNDNNVMDNTISSPATPSPGTPVLHQHHQHYNNNNSSSSSSGIGISNNICGTPATPTHSPQYNQSGSISSGSSCSGSGINSVPPAPPLTPGTSAGGRAQVVYSSGHKNSLKGTKLARRARSFKDDLVEKFSLMRNTTNNTLGRSHSPHSPRNKHASTKAPPTAEEVAKSSQTLETHVKDISNALKHFRDVILKKKLEVLPGNGTVILETIASMYSVIQSYTLNEQSTVLLSATQQVYLSLGKLIKLCDEVMLSAEDSGECPSLNDANVREVVDLLEDAVRNLVTLAQQKLKEKDDCAFLYTRPALIGIGDGSAANRATTVSAHHLMRPQLPEVAGQRTSLPDITLTPKERDILEKTKSNPIRASHSTESILRDTSPPPKPPLPNRTNNPPPLPPKRRSHPNQHHQHHHHQPQQQQHHHQHHHHHHHQQQHHHHPQQQHSNNISINSDLDCSSDFSLLNYGVDHLSVRSRSPDENSSQCSLDSALNHSREEEELKLLRSESRLDDNLMMPEDDIEKMFAIDSFVSMKSFRTSTQSVSKRSSDYSFQSSTKSSSSNSEIAFGINQENAASASATTTASASTSITNAMSSTNNSEFHYQQQQIQSTATTTTTIASSSSAVTSSSSTTRQLFTTSNTCGIASLSGLENAPDLLLSHLQQQQELLHGDEQQQQQQPPPPPALPPKMLRQGGRLSQYDNYDDIDDSGEIAELRHPLMQYALEQTQQQQQQIYQWQSKHQSLIEPRSNISLAGSCTAISSSGMDRQLDEPPPLPMKKKHILAYMEICSASTRSIEQHRHTMHSYNVTRNITHSQTMNIVPLTKELSPERETPPALPPKNYKPRKATTTPPTIITTPPPSPKPTHLSTDPYNNDTAGRVHGRVLSNSQPSGELMTTVCEEHSTDVLVEDDAATSRGISIDADADGDGNGDGSVRVDREGDGDGDGGVGGLGSSSSNISTDANSAQVHFHSHHLPNESACGGVSPSSTGSVNAVADGASGGKSPLMRVNNATNSNERTPICTPDLANDEDEGIDIILDNHKYRKETHPTHVQLPNMLEEIDITPYLIFKKDSEDGPEVKGGYIDALIVHASRVQKVADNAFSEAFITTFRTFIQPIDVIEKLTHRYTVFFCQVNDQKQKAAKETFSLLVRVVNDLTSTDLTSQLLTLLVEFVFQLVCSGQLYLAKLLRNKFVEKVTLYKDQKVQNFQADMFVTVTNQPSLLDLKSLEIAEQMTLLDAELFQKIEIPEVLLFAKEQCEEKSPNLNKFTEHFNKMSYWARSKILMLSDAKEREKHVIKFIKIMKHLRKMNNYNSYLALLSALDSAPIRRLEWHKTITEGLKEYCTLIDSSSSFRVYRQALAETNPPCIPYIGLVLQDLTFVHVGNQDYLTKGVINFSKRWQQYNIIVNMKRFKKCSYPFRRNERIIRFFENFENFLGEEEMWQISETIKPRGKRPANNY